MERRFPRTLHSLQSIFAFVDERMQGLSLPVEITPTLYLGIEEVFTNMMKYQHPGSEEVAIEIDIDQDAILIRLTDWNVGRFDPTAAADPDLTLPIEQRRPGGLGVFLTKAMMDGLEYRFNDGTSTIIMKKHIRRNNA